MTDDPSEISLTGWDGDSPSLIVELKRRAGLRTDHELARFLGVAQSTVSRWRERQHVPESALLRAERLLSVGGKSVTNRTLAARMIAMRLPEFWHQSASANGAKGGRAIFYRRVVLGFPAIIDAICEQLRIYEQQTGQTAWNLAPQLLEDDRFIEQLVEFAKTVPVIEGSGGA
jgi:hypothetical protein